MPTRDRILDATGQLFRRHGYTGTGLKQVVAAAHAPFGSLYHHFPGGKEQLGGEVIRASGRMYLELFEMVMDASPDPVAGIEAFFEGAAATLEETDYADACPIATVALEVASTSEALREATAEVFDSWIAAGTRRFTAAGLNEACSRQLTIEMFTGLEGAFILSRATRSTEAVLLAGARAVASAREAGAGGSDVR
ncbi:MAG: TetR/AcrR family transcriptional regulator [Thermoleophilaceae bacterium]|nr:TetR/AcrR family transcriptional regulator [Thermoleophilaceae bacterium]